MELKSIVIDKNGNWICPHCENDGEFYAKAITYYRLEIYGDDYSFGDINDTEGGDIYCCRCDNEVEAP
jgi:hypothetical protein